eukprot:143533-Pleurochrysis_carterae.AAC.5
MDWCLSSPHECAISHRLAYGEARVGPLSDFDGGGCDRNRDACNCQRSTSACGKVLPTAVSQNTGGT